MNEMVERVEDAISEACDYALPLFLLKKCARAAIEAMREPTEEMKEAGSMTMPNCEPNNDDAEQCWHEMIDKALLTLNAAETPTQSRKQSHRPPARSS